MMGYLFTFLVSDLTFFQSWLLKDGIIIIIIIITLCEFFTPALVDGFSLKFEWQDDS